MPVLQDITAIQVPVAVVICPVEPVTVLAVPIVFPVQQDGDLLWVNVVQNVQLVIMKPKVEVV